MILSTLVDYYNKNISNTPESDFYLSLYGQKTASKIKWLIRLNSDGTLKDEKPFPNGKDYYVPVIVRTSGKSAQLMFDNEKYIFGQGDSECYDLFWSLVERCAEETQNSLVKAVLKSKEYLKNLDLSEILDDKANKFGNWFLFTVDEFAPIYEPDVMQFWQKYCLENSVKFSELEEQCGICGEKHKLIQNILPIKVQKLNAPFLSFNFVSPESFGLTKMQNCPICLDCAVKSHSALDNLLNKDTNHYMISSGSDKQYYIYWSINNTETRLRDLLDPNPKPEMVTELFESVNKAQPRIVRFADQIHMLGLFAPQQGRVITTNWKQKTIQQLESNIANWFKAQDSCDYLEFDAKYQSLYVLLNNSIGECNERGMWKADRKLQSRYEKELFEYILFEKPFSKSLRVYLEDKLTTQLASNDDFNMYQIKLLHVIETIKRKEGSLMTDDVGYKIGENFAEFVNLQEKAYRTGHMTTKWGRKITRNPQKAFDILIDKAQINMDQLKSKGYVRILADIEKNIDLEFDVPDSPISKISFFAGYLSRKKDIAERDAQRRLENKEKYGDDDHEND